MDHTATTREIADHYAQAITSGRYQPGDRLPTTGEVAAELGVPADRVRSAYALLRERRMVAPVRGRGTVVLDLAGPPRLERAEMRRDGRGYYLNAAAERWVLISHSGVHRRPCPPDIAARLGVPVGTECVVRDRVLGRSAADVGRKRPEPMQISVSWLPDWLADELPVVAEADTGPGGVYDRIEERFGLLTWRLTLIAELATYDVAKTLSIPRQSAIMRQLRTSALPDGRVVEVLDQRTGGDQVQVEMPIPRHPSARRD